MPQRNVSLIVAMSENRVIGRGGQLPWHLSEDLKRFKRLTMGHHMIMGRKTYESIGRPLPGRTSIVVTRQQDLNVDPRVVVVSNVGDAYRAASQDDEVFVIGGGDIFRETLRDTTRIYLTLVHGEVEGDVYFPELKREEWEVVEESYRAADERNSMDSTYRVLSRK